MSDQTKDCPTCDGEGYVPDEEWTVPFHRCKCPACGGSGEVPA